MSAKCWTAIASFPENSGGVILPDLGAMLRFQPENKGVFHSPLRKGGRTPIDCRRSSPHAAGLCLSVLRFFRVFIQVPVPP